jgi:Alpha/beta hydrolase
VERRCGARGVGSLTSSLALQQLNAQGLHPVNDAVFYGSPGLELDNPSQLGLANGHAFVMKAPPGIKAGTVLAATSDCRMRETDTPAPTP